MSDLRKVWIYSTKENLAIILPVTPFVKFKGAMGTTSQDLFGFGEIGTGSSRKLKTWSCEKFFPHINNDYDFDVSTTKYKATYYVEVFERWMDEEQILRFYLYSDNELLRDVYCKIIGFSHGEEHGNKDIYYTLDFQEHRVINLTGSYIGVDNDAIIASYGSDTYYVAEGDTLITIAEKIFGDSTKWAYLMNLNNLNNPLNITVGQALKI